ncbi:MAG: phosphoglycerate mutase [Terriglobia bacterium]|nr:MAG: phosphoglycerate mutase [Terriglobia bacterium]
MLAQRLASTEIKAVYTSPLERAIETAEPIARKHGLDVRRVQGLGEISIGGWQGLEIAELDRHEDWRRFNTFRSGVRAPGGELMIETQARMIREIDSIRVRHPADTVAVVSHGDPLRSVIAYFLGISLDLVLRMELSTGSLTIVQLDTGNARVLCINQTEEVPL